MTTDIEALRGLQKDCGLKNAPTPLTYDLRRSVSGSGPYAGTWYDKPHRLLYDACSQIEADAARIAALLDELEAARADNQMLADRIADHVEETIASEFRGFWTAEDLVEEIPSMIRAALTPKDAQP